MSEHPPSKPAFAGAAVGVGRFLSPGLVAVLFCSVCLSIDPPSAIGATGRDPIAIEPPPGVGLALRSDAGGAPTLASDGRQLAFAGVDASGKQQLYLQRLERDKPQALPSTEGASCPFWSPDGRQLGFFADRKLKTISIATGEVRTLADAALNRGGTWGRDGTILFAPTARSPLWRVSAAGGGAVPATRFDDSLRENSHRWPAFLPDGRHFVYLAQSIGSAPPAEMGNIRWGELDSSNGDVLLRANSRVEYASGHLLFARQRVLMAQPFDPQRLRAIDAPFTIVGPIAHERDTGSAAFAAGGQTLVYQPAGKEGGNALIWLDRSGRRIGDVCGPGEYHNPRIAPDGRHFAYESIDPITLNREVWIDDVGHGRVRCV